MPLKEDFPGGTDSKSDCNAGDLGLIPGSGRPAGEENGNPLQYSCLENSTDREAWQVIVHGITKESDMTNILPLKEIQTLAFPFSHFINIGEPYFKIYCAPRRMYTNNIFGTRTI